MLNQLKKGGNINQCCCAEVVSTAPKVAETSVTAGLIYRVWNDRNPSHRSHYYQLRAMSTQLISLSADYKFFFSLSFVILAKYIKSFMFSQAAALT